MPSEGGLRSKALGLRRRFAAVFAAPGRASALLVLVALVGLRLLDPQFVEDIRLRGFDLAQRIAPRDYVPLPVHIVAIDEKSLSQYGQWPWPRTLLADVIRRIAEGRPRALGIDMLFTERDRTSPNSLAESISELSPAARAEIARLPSNEQVLAEALRGVPTVLGVGVSFEKPSPSPAPFRATVVRQSGGDARPFAFDYPTLIRNMPEIDAAARGRGALAGNADRDGIVRRVPLFVFAEGQLIPSLAFETLRVAVGARSLLVASGSGGVEAGAIGDAYFPTDRRGRVYPRFTPSLLTRYVSAADLLDGSFDPARMEGDVVLLGVTGLGLVDVKQTPFGLMPGVEVQAQLIESMIGGNLLRRPHDIDRAEIAAIAAIGLLAIFALPYGRPRVAAISFLALAAVAVGLELAALRWANVLLDGTFALMSTVVTFGVMLTISLRAAEGARRRLAGELQHEREIKARLDGELNAARAIQMGLLPHRFPGPPDHPGLDISATLEPARTVGGDLYDIEMLEGRRLFFAIADVSGKGVPAALFMAMTKEVLRAAVSKNARAFDAAIGEANDKICATSADLASDGSNMMFVTAFAGVLDLASGVVEFVSAGHDSPYILGEDGSVASIPADGGPPLGTVDGFPFPLERHQLRPGDAMVLYTDGVTEAENAEGAFYTAARLAAALAAAPQPSSVAAVVGHLREDVARFVHGFEQSDDLTLLALRWSGARG